MELLSHKASHSRWGASSFTNKKVVSSHDAASSRRHGSIMIGSRDCLYFFLKLTLLTTGAELGLSRDRNEKRLLPLRKEGFQYPLAVKVIVTGAIFRLCTCVPITTVRCGGISSSANPKF